MTYFSEDQVKLLLLPISPRRVLQRDGMSYVEGYDIRAELNRVFGFGRWSEEILDQGMVCETNVKTKNGRDAWYVVYRTRKRLTICAPDGTEVTHYDGSHVGESTHPVRGEAHGNALTNSETYALRRCAINLGDQFGLSLYNKGSLEPIVRWTLVRPESGTPAADTDDVPQVSAEEPAGYEPASTAEPESAQPAPQQQNGNGTRGQVSRPAPAQIAAPADADQAVIADWAAKVDEIASTEDADSADGELRKVYEGGRMTAATANAIRRAIKAKRQSVAQREMASAR